MRIPDFLLRLAEFITAQKSWQGTATDLLTEMKESEITSNVVTKLLARFSAEVLVPRHIQQFYTEKLKTVKPNSVIHYHAVIHQALKYALKTDLVSQNVAVKVDRPKKNDFQPVFLDVAERQHLFEVIKCTKLELPVLVAAFYGLRRGEVCGLKWDAIDFERGTLTVKRTVTSIQLDGKPR